MAPTRASTWACLLAAAALLAGCSEGPRTGVADEHITTDVTAVPTEDTSTLGVAPGIPDTPDLSGRVIDCEAIDEPCDHGEDPQLDVLWDACAAGDPRACDRLYYDSPFDTRYEQFGNTCGDRDVLVPCPDDLE